MVQNKTLKFYILIFTLLLAVIITAAYFLYNHQREIVRRERHIELSAISNEKVKQIIAWRNEKYSDASTLTNDGIFASKIDNYAETKNKRDSTLIFNWLKGYSEKKNYSSITILDTNLNCIACVNDIVIPDSVFLNRIVKSGQAAFSDFFMDADSSIYIDTYAPLILEYPGVYKKVGVIIFRTDPDEDLFDVIQTWPTPSSSSEILLFKVENDSVVYLNKLRHSASRPLTLRFAVSTEELTTAIGARGKRGIIRGMDYRGVPVLADIQEIPGSHWLTLSKIDLDEIYAPLNSLLRNFLIGGVLLVVSVGLLLGYMWRTQNAVLFRKLYTSEIEKQALLKNFEYLTKYANDIILLLDDKGKIIYANEKTSVQYGYTPEELLNMTIADLRLNPDEPKTEDIFSSAHEQGGLVYEAVHKKKDGTAFSIEASSRFINIDNKNFFQTIIRDISEKKTAEQNLKNALNEREVLLKEIHHRIKNNFQMISSLLGIQSTIIEDERVKKILRDSQNRINSMALIHQQLYTDNIAAVNTEDYLNNLIRSLIRSLTPENLNIRLSTDIDNTLLKMDKVIPLGLILNEILSNIFKHAFPGIQNGEIIILFKVRDLDFLLVVKDNGVGFPKGFDFSNNQTLGIQLIHVLTDQIDGTINISINEGTKFEINFPKSI